MFEIVRRYLVPALAVPVLVCSSLMGFTPGARAASGGTARCHCPCSVQCGGGVSCDCGGHGESCAKCSCAAAELEPKDILWLAETASVRPALSGSYAPWFSFDPHGEIRVALEATMGDTGSKDTFPIRFVQATKESLEYLPDQNFIPEALREWLRRADPERTVYLYAAAKDDPASYAIRDQDRSHLNESLRKVYSIRFGDGPWREMFTSESTLAWEMIVYLKSAVGQLPEEAFLADASQAKGALYDRIETLDLLLNAAEYDRALRVLDEVVETSSALGLDPSREEAVATVCAFRKMQSLLAPQKASARATVGGLPSIGTE